MKKFIFLLAAVLLTVINAAVFAQSTGINPMIDSTHTYTVNVNPTSTFTWTLEADAAGGGADLFGSGATDVAEITGGAGTNSITVFWNNPVVGDNYYLHINETAADGCTNRKVLAIEPANNFKIFAYNVTSAGALMTGADSLDYGVCAPDIASSIVWNGADPVTGVNAQDFTYDYDSVYFYYKVEAEGINFETTTWTPAMTIAQVDGTNATIKIDSIVGGTISGTPTWNETTWSTGSEITPTIPAAAGNDVLWVRVRVINGAGTPATANENITDNDYTYNLSLGSAGNSVDGDGNKTVNTEGTAPVQTQQARPDTGVIGFN